MTSIADVRLIRYLAGLKCIVGGNVCKKIQGVEIESEYIFHNSVGEIFSPNNWSHRNYEVFIKDMHEYYLTHEKEDARADIPILNPHELRYTRATIWVNEGKSLFGIAAVMGWGDLKMLREKYGHADSKSSRELLDI